MGSYDKVQFMSWELHTGPAPGAPDGLPDQEQDIAARLAFATDAVARAELFSDQRASTLKVFLGPACVFRGTGAGYVPDLSIGPHAPPASLSAGLHALGADAAYDHWVFVFGAALGRLAPPDVGDLHGISLVGCRGHSTRPEGWGTDGALFRIPGMTDSEGVAIDFRVALDLARGPVAGARARIQLAPTCGVMLDPDLVELQPPRTSVPTSYVLQCDGLWNLNGACGNHTRLWGDGGALARAPWRLVETSRDAAHVGTELIAVASELPTAQGMVSAHQLWHHALHGGAGKVRMIAPLSL